MTTAVSMSRGLPSHSGSWRGMPLLAQALIGGIIAVGTAILVYGGIQQNRRHIAEVICYLGIAILATKLKVNLPGITGTLSVNFLFILIGVLELSFSETLTLGAVAMIAQGFYPDRLKPIQITFNVCAGAISTALAYAVFNAALPNRLVGSPPILLVVAGRAAAGQDSGRLLFLVISVLPGGSGDRGGHFVAESQVQLGDIAAPGAGGVFNLPVLSALPRQTGG